MNELLILVQSALEGVPVKGADYESLCRWDSSVWERIVELAGRQSVLGLVYVAVRLLPKETTIPENVVFKFVAEGEAIQARGRVMEETAEKLIDHLIRCDLHPILIKGSETARFYPFPAFREYGDIDLYITPEEKEGTLATLCNAGFEILDDSDGNTFSDRNGIKVDIHQRYYDLSCPQETLPAPGTPEATLLMLSAHALKHAAGLGIGLRHVCDIAAAFRTLDGSYNPEYYLQVCRKAGILPWSRLLNRFLSEYLRVPDRLFPENRVSPQPLMDIIREGGNFGHYADHRPKTLQGPVLLRKADTVFRMIRRLPFSLRYAPREVLPGIRELIRRNI